MDPKLLTVESTRTAIAAKQFTAANLVKEFYEKIEAEDGDIHAYLTLCRERALQQAARIDDLAGRGEAPPPLACEALPPRGRRGAHDGGNHIANSLARSTPA